MKILISFWLCLQVSLCSPAYTGEHIPVTISIRSIKDLKVAEGQTIKIGQVLAPKPLEEEITQDYFSQRHQREVEKQKRILASFRRIVKEEKLPDILIQHEEAKLKDLEFKAKEHQLISSKPKTFKETVYRSPVNGVIQRITPLGSSNGLLSVEFLVELD